MKNKQTDMYFLMGGGQGVGGGTPTSRTEAIMRISSSDLQCAARGARIGYLETPFAIFYASIRLSAYVETHNDVR